MENFVITPKSNSVKYFRVIGIIFTLFLGSFLFKKSLFLNASLNSNFIQENNFMIIVFIIAIWIVYFIISNDLNSRKIIVKEGILTSYHGSIFGTKQSQIINLKEYDTAVTREIYWDARCYNKSKVLDPFGFYSPFYVIDFKSKNSKAELKLSPYNKESIIKLLQNLKLYINVESDLIAFTS